MVSDTRLGAMLAWPAVSVEDRRLDVADLLLLGVIIGTWSMFEREVLVGLDLEAAHRGLVGADEVRQRATRFRYAHGLVSAAEFTTWLRERSLSIAQLSGVLARALLRERLGVHGTAQAGQRELEPVLRAEALCHGVLDTLAGAAAERLAAAHRVGGVDGFEVLDGRADEVLGEVRGLTACGLAAFDEQELRHRLGRLYALDDALGRLRRELADADVLRRRMASHGLDWLRLSGEQLSLGSEGAAREARLLLADDGLSPSEVALRAGTDVRERSLYLDEAPAQLAGTFAAAAPGQPVGPWREGDCWNVLMLHSKSRPSLEDPVLRERAVEELLREVIERHAAGRTERHCVL
jgi:hypothetical protein